MRIPDVATVRPIVGADLSGDGALAAIAIPEPDPERGARPLWVSVRSTAPGARWRRIVAPAGTTTTFSPAFAPDHATLAFLAGGHEGVRVCVAGARGTLREARPLAGTPRNAGALKWTSGWRGPSCLGDDADGHLRLYHWPSLDAPPVALTPPGVHAGDYALRPGGRHGVWLPIPVLGTADEETLRIRTLPKRGGAGRALPLDGRPVGYLAYSPDGARLAYVARRRGARLSVAELWVAGVDPGGRVAGAVRVAPGLEGWLSGYDWEGPDALLLAIVQSTEGRLVRADLATGDVQLLPPQGRYASGPHADDRGQSRLWLEQDLAELQSLRFARAGEAAGVLWRDPRGAKALALAAGERFAWTGGDGADLEGVLVGRQRAPAPCVVWIHGGPAEHVARTFSAYFQVFASAGMCVFAPNYRGSTGRDEAFLRALRGRLGVLDVDDVARGVEALVDRGIVDPARVALVGWSYGGSIALRLAADRPSLAKAVIAGAPVADWVGLFGAPRFPAALVDYFERPLWEDRAPYDAASALTWVGRVEAPTLLLHGAGDPIVPDVQSRLLYRALRARGVPTDLMIYPGEGHVPSSPRAVEDMLERMLAWLGPVRDGGPVGRGPRATANPAALA